MFYMWTFEVSMLYGWLLIAFHRQIIRMKSIKIPACCLCTYNIRKMGAGELDWNVLLVVEQ